MKVKYTTLDFCFCEIGRLNYVIDKFKSQFRAREVVPDGKFITVDKDKNVVAYRKWGRDEFFVYVNGYKIIG